MVLTVLLAFKLQATQKEDSVALTLFNKTIALISEYSDSKEYNGPICETISSNVYSIVYNFSDSLFALKKKLDLLHLMLFNQKVASSSYRSIIFNKVLAQDTVVLGRREFVAPLLFCYYCGDTKVLEAIRNNDTLSIEIDSLPQGYQAYFKQLLSKIQSIDCSQNPNSRLAVDLNILGLARNLKPELLKKYPG